MSRSSTGPRRRRRQQQDHRLPSPLVLQPPPSPGEPRDRAWLSPRPTRTLPVPVLLPTFLRSSFQRGCHGEKSWILSVEGTQRPPWRRTKGVGPVLEAVRRGVPGAGGALPVAAAGDRHSKTIPKSKATLCGDKSGAADWPSKWC